MFVRTIRPSLNTAQRAVVVPAPRYSSHVHSDPEVIEREKQKNLRGEQVSTHNYAPGWNEALATDSEAHVKADKAIGSPQDLANSTLDFLKRQYPDSWSEAIREHTNAPYIKDAVEGPLGALEQATKRATKTIAKAAATRPEEAQGTLSDEGARAERARAARESAHMH